ncbi:TRAP transporter substrate-binding protein [Xanthobacter aminoxidans]|uniref:TRAP transporter substrate-binding protein n=1 Tax=Xanthobacter aminoxidans TaxID=186280 RepID=UPI003729CF34
MDLHLSRRGAALFALTLLAMPGSTGIAAHAAEAPITLRLSHGAAPSEPYQIGLEKFRDEIEKSTDGAIKVQIFPSGQLGDEASSVKGVQAGTISMAVVAGATIADYAPVIRIFDLPFLFASREQAYKVADGPIGKSADEKLAEKGLVLLGYFEAGVRNVLNNQRPITTLADFKGMKVRVVPSPMNIDTFRALGANPVPLPYGQLYTSLQTHVVDGAEAANTNYLASKFYEVAPYYALVRWQVLMSPVVISKKVFDRLTPEQQAKVRAAAAAAVTAERNAYQATDNAAFSDLTSRGVKVTEPPLEPWIAAVKPVWDKWAPVVGEDNLKAALADK